MPAYLRRSVEVAIKKALSLSFYRSFIHEYLLGKIRSQDPGKIFLKDITLSRTETYGRVTTSVANISSGLNKIGFGQGDVICMYCANYVEYW